MLIIHHKNTGIMSQVIRIAKAGMSEIPLGADEVMVNLRTLKKGDTWDQKKWADDKFSHKIIDGKIELRDGYKSQKDYENDPYIHLRALRNSKLTATDWMGNSDVTMSAEMTTYRQALRDLPSNSTPELDDTKQLTGVNWPEEPTP